MTNWQRLTQRQRRDLIEFAMENNKVKVEMQTINWVNGISKTEVVNNWLEWNGIKGYTLDIISLVTNLFDNNKENAA